VALFRSRAPYLNITLLGTMTVLAACARYAPAQLTVTDLGKPTVQTADLPGDADIHALLRMALAHDPAVAAARATLTAALSSQKAAHNLPPLSLTLTTEYSRDSDPQKPWLYGAAVGIPLDVGAKRATRVTSTDLAVIRARYALAEAVWVVRQNLHQALNDLSLAQQDIDLNQTLLDQRLSYQSVMQARVSHGEDAQGLAAQAALDVSGARQGLAQAETRKIQAVAALARTLSTDPATAASLPVRSDDPDAPTGAQLASMTDRALYCRADVLTAVVDYDIAENDLRTAIAAQYPDINIQPGYTWERGAVKLPLSLSLTLPPLDGNRAAINAAQNTRLAAGKTLEDRVRTTRATAIQAATTYAADATTARTIADHDLPVLRDMADRAGRLATAGETDQSEALLARINATQAALNLLQARRTAATDRLTLEDALHQSFDATDTQILTDAVKVQP
jgi:CRISPR system Cascade subunit CasA